jgi:hypothetical protein
MALAIFAHDPSSFESDAIPAKYYWCAMGFTESGRVTQYFRTKTQALAWAAEQSPSNFRIDHCVYVRGMGRWRMVAGNYSVA